MKAGFQFQKYKQYSLLSILALRNDSQTFLFLCLFLFLNAAHALNPETVVSVDHRVTVSYSAFKFDPKKNTYTTKVHIKNHSAAPLLAPLHLTITHIDNTQFKILNINGVGPDSLPYREVKLLKGVLAPGQTTEATTLVFVEEAIEKTPPRKLTERHSRQVSASTRYAPFDFKFRVSAAVSQTPLEPRATPYALKVNNGKIPVRFSVVIVGKGRDVVPVSLRRMDTQQVYAMNDQGKEGDIQAGDGIYGVNVILNTASVKAGSCLAFEAYTRTDRVIATSPPYKLCISSFPVRIAKSNTSHLISLPDGSKAVADEVLVHVVKATNEAQILRLANNINATIVGSILPSNLYQLKLANPLSAKDMMSLIKRVQAHAEVENAYVNALGEFSSTPNDPEFPSQHGLTLVRAHDAWDATATGSGSIVAVLDSGIDRTHPDFGTVGDCQLADNDCGLPSTDLVGHGTQVAGVIAAKTNNALGIASIAPSSKIKSIIASADSDVLLAEMQQAFADVTAYGVASVINASFSRGPLAFAPVVDLCGSINAAVINGVTPVAVVVAAAGNSGSNGFFYPARCNDSSRPDHAALTRKDLFITVANSLSTTTIDPLCAPASALNQLCGNSNYGTWVDIAAPGMSLRTTAVGGGYISATGTSIAAPVVTGAAAILSSCGVPFDQIESTLKSGPLIPVTTPDGALLRLDIYEALKFKNLAPTAVSLSSSSINENTDTSGGFEVGTLTAVDPNTCDRFSYSIVGGADAAFFSIGGAGLDRLLLTAGILNFEVKNTYSVTVRVTDFFGLTFDQALNINVNNINEAPAGSNATLTINEDAAHTFAAANFGFSDPDDLPAPNSLSAVIISTVPAAGALELGGIAVTAGQSIAAADFANLTFTPAANANGNGYASFTFQVVDDGGTANGGINTDASPNTLTFDVTPLNDPPTGLLSISGTLSVGQTLTAITLAIADADGLGAFNYQWLRGAADIAGATGSSYTLVAADIGNIANVRVCYTDGGGTLECLNTTNATNTGDPHLTTVDGLHFDFQAAGEFVALRGSNGMEIQTRQTPVSTAAPLADSYSGLPVGVSINTAVAARVGSHRVTLQPNISGLAAASGLELRIDGVGTRLPASGIQFASGGRLVPIAGDAIQIDFPDTTTLVVTPGYWAPHSVWYLNVKVFHTPAQLGLMGIREQRSWLPRLADGSSLGARPVALHDRYVDLYEKFAYSWRVTDETSLFDYATGTSSKTFTLKEWPRENPPHVVPQGGRATKPLKREIALKHCHGVAGKNDHADCVFDVMVTGHPGFAKTLLFGQKIQRGLTATVVRGVKGDTRPNENLKFIALVMKHAPAAALITDNKDAARKEREDNSVPTGFIQFKLNGKNIGERVRLDARGQAVLNISRKKVGGGQIAASYLPAKGSVFLPSSSSNQSVSFEELKKRSRVLKGAR
ncbi:MAG TPA: S8 family serine peptidase [Gallionellaceae bacterium]|nr:S8 family serine peptidase [Gallionellaceae bacterium]HQS76303.1 S8 family serine peptidase [Gallionellaceae bacterium]